MKAAPGRDVMSHLLCPVLVNNMPTWSDVKEMVPGIGCINLGAGFVLQITVADIVPEETDTSASFHALRFTSCQVHLEESEVISGAVTMTVAVAISPGEVRIGVSVSWKGMEMIHQALASVLATNHTVNFFLSGSHPWDSPYD